MATIEKILRSKGLDLKKLIPEPSPAPPQEEPAITQDGVDIHTQLQEDERAALSQMANEEREDTLRAQTRILRSQKRGRLKIVSKTPKPEPVTSLVERIPNMDKPTFRTKTLNWQIFTLLFSRPKGYTLRELYEDVTEAGTKTTRGAVGTAVTIFVRMLGDDVIMKTEEKNPLTENLVTRYRGVCPKGSNIVSLYESFLATKRGDRPTQSTEILKGRKKSIDRITNKIEAAEAEPIQRTNTELLVPRNIEVKHYGEVTVNINIRISLTN